jgi:hypothetical protein
MRAPGGVGRAPARRIVVINLADHLEAQDLLRTSETDAD